MKKKIIIGIVLLACIIILSIIDATTGGFPSVSYYYGIYDGAVVLDIKRGLAISAITLEYVAGYNFYSPNGNLIDVWYNGNIYSLSEAYENGFLSEDDISDIYNKNVLRYPESKAYTDY